jgi:hypothetical protein
MGKREYAPDVGGHLGAGEGTSQINGRNQEPEAEV